MCLERMDFMHEGLSAFNEERKEDGRKWEDQLPEVAETIIDRRHFSTAENKFDLHVFADALEDFIYALAYPR